MTDALAPFVPGPDRPWDATRAAHLARRAGFGASPAEVERLVELGPDAAVEHFVAFPTRDEDLERALAGVGSALATKVQVDTGSGAFEEVERLRRRWLFRMVHGRFPLHQKLVLFWHDHFATAQSKVLREPLLERQLQLLYANAGGPFRQLLGGIARDPAMLVLLDNRLSEKGRPNENWARELMELYSLGRDRYTQADVVAMARIFTGWSTPALPVPEFVYRAEWHDEEDKVLFGQPLAGRSGREGMEEGEEALDRIVARAHCPAFLAGKLARWFVSHDPDPAPVARLAEVLSAHDLDVRSALRVLLRSRWFHEPAHEFALYKNPVELAVGTLRLLEVQNAHLAGLERLTRSMGMQLFEPPSVAGWEHGEGWVDSGALINRFNFALEVSELPHTSRRVEGRPALDLDDLAGEESPAPARLVDRLTGLLLGRPLEAAQYAAVVEYLERAAARDPDDATPRQRRRSRVRAALHLVLTAPQYAMA